jgi:hypothetical protein
MHPYADKALVLGRTGEMRMRILWITRQELREKMSSRLRRRKERKRRKRKKKKKTLGLSQILPRR